MSTRCSTRSSRFWRPNQRSDRSALIDRDDADAGGVDAHRADRSGADFDPPVEIERHPETKNQRGADHVAVAGEDDRIVRMALAQLHEHLDNAALHLAHRL